jgi:filamentous hemagglutinin
LSGAPISLEQTTIKGVNIPLPLEIAEGPHTVFFGGELATDGTWPKPFGVEVPWGRVDWAAHEYLPGPHHPNPHIHEFVYDQLQKKWASESAKPFYGH